MPMYIYISCEPTRNQNSPFVHHVHIHKLMCMCVCVNIYPCTAIVIFITLQNQSAPSQITIPCTRIVFSVQFVRKSISFFDEIIHKLTCQCISSSKRTSTPLQHTSTCIYIYIHIYNQSQLSTTMGENQQASFSNSFYNGGSIGDVQEAPVR
jgi:hypothetical protein